MVKVGVIIIIVGALALWGSADAPKDEILVRGVIAGLFLLALPAVYAWKLAGAPALLESAAEARGTAQFNELTTQIDALKTRLEPVLELEFSETDGIIQVPVGSRLESAGGQVTGNVGGHDTLLRVQCRNLSIVSIADCEAKLISVHEIDANGSARPTYFTNNVLLVWGSELSGSRTHQTVDPGIPSHFSVLKQYGEHGTPIIMSSELTLEEIQLLEKTKKYRMLIQVGTQGLIPQRIELDISWSGDPGMFQVDRGETYPFIAQPDPRQSL